MSKAFTSEETPAAAVITRKPPVLQAGEVRYVTPEGRERLQAVLERLHAALAEAAGLRGSERASRIADLERRMALVAGTLAALTVLGPDAAPAGSAAFATWVTIEDEDGRRSTWRIVGPDEADPGRGLVSVHSPLGRALLGRAAGEPIRVERPDGCREYRVLEVRRTAP